MRILTANRPRSYAHAHRLIGVQVGDTVIVKATGRRALVAAVRPLDHYQVEFLPDLAEDPIDRDSSESADESGIYPLEALAPLE